MSVMVYTAEELAQNHMITGAALADLVMAQNAQVAAWDRTYQGRHGPAERVSVAQLEAMIASYDRHDHHYKVVADAWDSVLRDAILIRYNAEPETGDAVDQACDRIEAAAYRATRYTPRNIQASHTDRRRGDWERAEAAKGCNWR